MRSLSGKPMSKTTYLRRKAEGLCVRCGGEIESDRQGKIMCFACNAKETIRASKERRTRSDLGLCPRCGKVKLIGDQKNCDVCSAENYVRRETQRRLHPEKELIYRKHTNEKRRQKRKNRIANNLCAMCGEPLKACDGECVTCLKCRVKHNEFVIQYKKPPVPFEETKPQKWKAQGLCPYCGKQLYGKFDVCEEHYKVFSEAGRKGKEHYGL